MTATTSIGTNLTLDTLGSRGTVYNSIGKQSDTYDANQNQTHYDYDQNGRLQMITYPDNTTSVCFW